MTNTLTAATWFWLLGPMLGCVALSLLTVATERRARRRAAAEAEAEAKR